MFDFGNISGSSGQNYLFYSPHTSLTGQRLSVGTSSTVTFDTPGILDNRTVHVVCIVDPTNRYCAVYTNGVLQSQLTTTLPALSGVSTAWSFLGRSLFSADAWLNASIKEFRIYDGRLTPAEITANDKAGPDALALPVSFSSSNSPSSLALSWPSWAVGYGVQSTTNVAAGNWTPVTQAAALSGDQWWLNLPLTNGAKFFRLQR